MPDLPKPKRGRRLQFAPSDPPERIAVTIHRRQADWIRARDLNRSSLVRQLLDRYITHVEADEKQKRNGKPLRTTQTGGK